MAARAHHRNEKQWPGMRTHPNVGDPELFIIIIIIIILMYSELNLNTALATVVIVAFILLKTRKINS